VVNGALPVILVSVALNARSQRQHGRQILERHDPEAPGRADAPTHAPA
jgi:hypothetical protein